jgi:hypothetical protein
MDVGRDADADVGAVEDARVELIPPLRHSGSGAGLRGESVAFAFDCIAEQRAHLGHDVDDHLVGGVGGSSSRGSR